MPSKSSPHPSRRLFLQGAAASTLALPLAGLFGRRAQALARLEPIPSPYGPVAPVLDQTTGLPLLQLPAGFTYQCFAWSGDLMADGRPNPTRHDGMAVVRSRLVNGKPEFTLIRNHEAKVNPLYGTIEARGFYDRGTALFARRTQTLTRPEPISSPYVGPVLDPTTGLPLPEGFTFHSFALPGAVTADGRPNPTRHDGVAVVRSRLVNGNPEFTLIRNHEATVNPLYGTIEAPGFYDRGTALVAEDDDKEITGPAAGGTTKLVFTDDRFTAVEPALGGTWTNCAGGPTPWGTWITCEEDKSDFTDVGGQPHGYAFEVSPETGETTGTPIKAMGRMNHEAVAVDPIGGAIYLTEDDRNQSGFYKFVPNDMSQRLGSLEQGGMLYMARIAGTGKADLLNPSMGDQHRIEWVRIEDPDLAPESFAEAPFDAENTASGPFVQGRDQSALRMSRLEGIWYSPRERLMYIVDTSSGKDMDPASEDFGAEGFGDGSVWTFDPATDTLTCLFQSENPQAGNNFDNITVSPRGGVLLCEDGGGVEDAFGMGERLMGLTPAGETYLFAKNNVQLTAADIQKAGKSVEFIKEGDYRDAEWAGATFDPSGRWLFVNLQSPGITFAITGPWERGLL